MVENFHDHVTPNIWPSSSPDLIHWITTCGALLREKSMNTSITSKTLWKLP